MAIDDIPPEYRPVVGLILEHAGVKWRDLCGAGRLGQSVALARQNVIYALRQQAIERGDDPKKASPFSAWRVALELGMAECSVRESYELCAARLGGYALRATVETPDQRAV